ncbi:MAG: LysR family transcriptional regulator [Gordonia sp. (in: high G+C Gram-positive bacteria)]|uniref:LysR family transcriptional regulator n=1 Tax=Gordonia sp. (in: high G+C Gram-positive bacteria) TaxID=84139 RepID=UPI0039E515B3
MLFRQLEYFVAVAQERHFARAAAACYVSQPALSEAIRKLEHELGVPLIRRAQSFQGLTPEGEQLVRWARRLLADRASMRTEAATLREGLSGELRLGVVPGAVTTVAALADRFCADRPAVRVSLTTGLQSADVLDRIRRFELDAGLVYPRGLDTAGLVVTPLYTEELVLIGARGMVDGEGPPPWDTLADLPLCLLRPGMRGRELIDEAAAEHGVRLDPRIEADSIASLIALVGTGNWAAIVPSTWLPAVVSAETGSARVESTVLGAARTHVALVRADVEPAPVLTAAFEREALSHGDG